MKKSIVYIMDGYNVKRFITFLLVISVFCCSTSMVFAMDQITETEENTTVLMQEEIAVRTDEVYASVYSQLEAQGAEDMIDIYMSIIIPQIEQTMQYKYFPESANVMSTRASYNFPYGGVVKYTNSLSANVAVTYMCYDCTYKHILLDGTCVARTVIEGILGALPSWGTVFTTLVGLNTVASSSARTDVANAGGRGYIISVSANGGADTSSVLVGWDGFPYASIPSGATNISYRMFPSNGHDHLSGAS